MLPAVRPRASFTHPPPPAPYLRPQDQRRRSPSRPGLSREGSLTSPRPAATSANSPSSAGAGPRNNQVRGWRQKGGGGGKEETPSALPSRGNPLPPTPRRPQSAAQNGDQEQGTGASTTIHLLRERARSNCVYWSLSSLGQPWPTLIGKHLPPPHSQCEHRKSRKGVAIGQSGEARFLEAWLPSKMKDKRKLRPFPRRQGKLGVIG